MKRVVVTGGSGLSPIGSDWATVEASLRGLKSGVRYMPDWEQYEGLLTHLAAPVEGFETPDHYSRRQIRAAGRVALLSMRASELALEESGLLGDDELKSGCAGVAYGSSVGSIPAVMDFVSMVLDKKIDGITATSYIKMMPHTSCVNVGLLFGLKGRVIPTGTACTSGSLAIGYAYETIKHGYQSIMLAGGAEELSPTEAAVFDTLYATSTVNDAPETVPRPFDRDRDGLVIGEGAGTLVLEELEHAKARGANILAEVVGFGTNTDGKHVTQPTAETMEVALRKSLECAGLDGDAIGYVDAHGTATEHGDVAESIATQRVFGRPVPISSQKSYMGHTLGACGSLEAWMAINMMNSDWYAPTLNLKNVDERCAELDYIMGDGREMSNEYIMNNNFAFGGINTSLIFKRWA